jgi:hypothetical protein
MKLHVFPILPNVAAVACAAFAAVLVSGAAPPAHVAAAPSAQLSAIIRAALVQAPGNFAAWRSGTKSIASDGVSYKLSSALSRICPVCDVSDEYATANSDERYAVTFLWAVPSSWSRAQTIAYIQLHIGELVPNFTARQGTNDNDENWFDWRTGTPTQFVNVRTFSDKSGNGFEVRVGHYLQKNVHYKPYARLTPVQRDDLANAVRSFVQLGVQNGSDNFLSLRAGPPDKGTATFGSSVSFGDFLKTCHVDGNFANEHASGGTSKWIFECTTPSLGGAKSDIEAVIRAAVVDALPSGFAVTTDPTYLSLSDYRWDRSSDTMDVEVTAYDNNDGTFDYHIEVYHFTS